MPAPDISYFTLWRVVGVGRAVAADIKRITPKEGMSV